MSSDPIVSHVANRAYREHVDEMTCKATGCKRWKVGDGSEFCEFHESCPPLLTRSQVAAVARRIGKTNLFHSRVDTP